MPNTNTIAKESRPWRELSPLLLATAVTLTGCGGEELRVYRVPKEKPAAAAHAGHQHTQPTAPSLEWQLPSGWVDRGPGRMTMASFGISGGSGQAAEVSIMPMAGERDLGMLVNIVRTSSGLNPVSDEELLKVVENITVPDGKASLVDLTDTTGASGEAPADKVLLAVLTRAGMTWLIKMAGNAELVSAQKGTYLEFLKSIRFTDPAGPPAVASAPTEAPAPGPNSGAGEMKPQWEVPSHWQEVPPTEMLRAKFVLPGPGDARAELTVSVFPGEVGGVLANVNRWRKQVNLPEVGLADLSTVVSALDVVGGKAMLVDMSGQDSKTSKKARLVGVILPQGNRTWFYKLMGDEGVAEKEKAAFVKFVQTAKHPHAG